MPVARPPQEHGLRAHPLRGKKWLGQHFLVDERAILRIVDAADLSEQDTVLEIGPGPGTLTGHLARRAGRVVAVEVDEEMLAPLREAVQGLAERVPGVVQVVHGDILEQDVDALVGGGAFKVVANLPYYITSAVLRHVLGSTPRPTLLVVTVQREVAERIAARPGQMSLLSVSVQFYGQPQIVARIPPGAFRPVPRVHSAVVRVDCYDPLPWGPVDEAAFFRAARAGFGQRRKQLHNALANGLPMPVEQVLEALAAAGIDGRRRAETLHIAEWVALSNALI